MPPLRFLHAAGLAPDGSLADPPAGHEETFKAAPTAAITRFVSLAIEQKADFVVVSASPTTDGLSPAAERVLRTEFDRLFDGGVTVFLAVPHGTGWERLAGQIPNVILLTPGSFAPVSDADGTPAGILRCIDRPEATVQPLKPRPGDSLDLAVAPALALEAFEGGEPTSHDFIALGTGARGTVRLKEGVAHSPGPLQARGAAETGPHGATLVTIAENGDVTTAFLATATVRFEGPKVAVESKDVIEDVALRMADWIEEQKPAAGEGLWVVRWTLEGARPLCDSLSTEPARSDLLDLLPDRAGGVPVVHAIAPPPKSVRAKSDGDFAAKFAAALEASEPALTDVRGRLSLAEISDDAPHRDRLARLFESADAARVLSGALDIGTLVAAAANESE